MSYKKEDFYTLVNQAIDTMPGSKESFALFKQRVTLNQCSPSLINNYGRNISYIALCQHIADVMPNKLRSPLDTLYEYKSKK